MPIRHAVCLPESGVRVRVSVVPPLVVGSGKYGGRIQVSAVASGSPACRMEPGVVGLDLADDVFFLASCLERMAQLVADAGEVCPVAGLEMSSEDRHVMDGRALVLPTACQRFSFF